MVHLIKGRGNLFWSRGMHTAWQIASLKDFDFYIWLNDDMVLYPNCFDELFRCHKSLAGPNIICGVIESKDKSNVIYGGYNENRELISPWGQMREVTYMNGNIVLIPKEVFQKLGNLDKKFHHDLGDVDYGLRALKNGIGLFTTSCSVGMGEKNALVRERCFGVSIKKRFLKLYSPLGSNPFINFYFRRRHFGYINAILYFLFQHLLNFLPDELVTIIFTKKYN
jgi:GT2 family glycosyltransferase